jgi:hypothetical protein
MQADELRALIERVEAATGTDAELDKAAARAPSERLARALGYRRVVTFERIKA